MRRTPQEKKRLSYLKDRRNNYAENDKSSRSSIRRNKRAPHGANRRRQHLVLAALTGRRAPDEDAVEQRLAAKRPKRWRKQADETLGEMVAAGLERRLGAEPGDAARTRARIRRVRRSRGRPD